MNLIGAAIGTELLKSRRSRVPWAIALGFSIAPLVTGLFMIILKDPERARQLGLIGTKAQLTAGTADWPTLLGMLAQTLAIGGAILFAFLTAWVFGREFADHTIRGLLAVPTPRWAIVVAKSVVVTVWGIAISAWVVALGILVGGLVGLPGWSSDLLSEWLGRMALITVLTIGLQSTTAFVAGIGRGYIPPLGWAVLTMAAAQILAVLGWGQLFPWAVPAVVSGAGGSALEAPGAMSYLIVLVTAAVGSLATVAWWERADQAE